MLTARRGGKRGAPSSAESRSPGVVDADDDELMACVQRRDQAAFGRLLSRHLDSVHRYLMRLTGSSPDADELCQETFHRVWQRAASYRPGTVKLSTWVHRIAHNLAVDELRRRRPAEALPDELTDDAADPEALAAASQAGQRLRAALDALPENQRAALLLCQVQGFSNSEAAAILGVTARSVESLIARGRRTLRSTLLPDWKHDHRQENRGS